MDNKKYLDSIGVQGKNRQRCSEVMAKYGENKWWEPDVDPRKFAYHQIKEPVLLTNDFDHLHGSLELLLGRPVYQYEMTQDALEQEAERAWTYQVGCTSDTEKMGRVTEGMEAFRKQYSGRIIDIQLPEE